MSTSTEEPPAHNMHLLDHPCADVVLRTRDSHEFRVPKVYLIDSSPVLAKLIRTLSYPSKPDIPVLAAEIPLPVVQLSDTGGILSSLLSFIIPVTPDLPSNVEDTMELLSTAQKYEMSLVLTRIRGHLAQQTPPLIRDETAFNVYSLAQKYSLRQEASQAARFTLKDSMSIEDMESTSKLDILPGALLHELWRYHQRVREHLKDDLEDLRVTIIEDWTRISIRCTRLTDTGVPIWLSDYIGSVATNPAPFNLTDFHLAVIHHIVSRSSACCSSCGSMAIDTFWAAFSDVVQHSIEKAEGDLLLECEMQSRRNHLSDPTTKVLPPQCLTIHDADVVLQSSDHVHFHVRRSILSMSSPFFRDMFSLPQPADSEFVDGLPVVHLSEDSEVLHTLVTMLYPIPSVITDDYDKALTLLAAAQKYDMATVQSSIRAEMKGKKLHPLTASATFRAYGFASAKGLVPEIENVARHTLDFPMTFESMGDELSTFGGWALRDLAHYRKRCRDTLISCLDSLLDARLPPLLFWVGCPNTPWLEMLLRCHIKQMRDTFTPPLLKSSSLRAEYLKGLQSHIGNENCTFCPKVHALHGETFWEQVESKLDQALDAVHFNPDRGREAGPKQADD